MGTSNFRNVNASKIFVICQAYEDHVLDDDGNETEETYMRYPESWEFDEEVANIRCEIKSEATKHPGVVGDYYNWVKDDNDRNYPSTYLASLRASRVFGDIGVDVYIHAFARSGYYDAANLDWEMEIDVDGETQAWDDLEYAIDTVRDCAWSNMNAGLRAIMANYAGKWALKQEKLLVGMLEGVFEQWSEPYGVIARFSNGETMYRKL